MELLYARCAGLDVHARTVVACARIASAGTVTYHQRTVATITQGLLELADWLAAHGWTHVAMESTGVYWKPVWHILDGQFELTLANAMHVRNVPGRKSDMKDARWLADLLAMGSSGAASSHQRGFKHCGISPAPANNWSARSRAIHSAFKRRSKMRM